MTRCGERVRANRVLRARLLVVTFDLARLYQVALRAHEGARTVKDAMPPLPDTHPDGDPFAEQDQLKEANSLIGRLERQAKADALRMGLDENGQKKSERATTSLGTGKDGKEILIVDTSDDDLPSEEEAQATDGEEDDDDGDTEGEDAEVDATSGADGEGDEGSGLEQDTRVKRGEGEEGDDEDDDDDDSEEDDSESDTASSIGTGEQEQDGDVSMADAQGDDDPTKPKSPVKASTSNGDGAPGAGEGGSPKKDKKKRRRRARNRSPSPPPLEPKKPPPTVRLSVMLPARTSAETPQYNVIQMAKDAGILPDAEKAKTDGANPADELTESESDGQGGRRKKDKGKAKADGGNEPGPPVRVLFLCGSLSSRR